MKNIMLELEQLRAKHGVKKNRRSRQPLARANFPDLKQGCTKADLSNTITKGGHKRDKIFDHRWKRGQIESVETVREIEAKRSRVAIQSSKAAYMYITPGSDPKDFGRK